MKAFTITLLSIFFLATTAYADMDSATYFAIEINARQLTISGMQERLTCMRDSDCPASRAAAIDEESQSTIVNMYQQYQTTPSRLAAYYSNNIQAINVYLAGNPTVQMTLNQLTATFESLSNEITPLLEMQ